MKNKGFISVCFAMCAMLCFGGCNASNNGTVTSVVSENTLPSENQSPTSSLSSPASSETIQSSNSDDETNNSEVSATVGPYTIKDIYNVRGISNKKTAHSFGVAKDGKPHSISVNYQKYFDSNPQYKGLVLDNKSNDKCMYLTFDCGYEYQGLTGEILDVLKEKNVKAAFFCTLSYIKNNPEFIERMINEGHIVANHSDKHPDFTKISRERMANEIYNVEKYLKDNYNYTAKYFRFPEGSYSPNALDLVSSMGYRSVFWSIAHADYDTDNQPTVDKTIQTVTSRYHSGAVILLHAISKSNTEALATLIDEAQNDGYTFKSLDEYNW